MTVQPVIQSGGSARGALLLATLLPAAMFLLAACSSSNPAPGVPTSQAATKSMTPPDPDPRVGLRAGKTDAAIASWNMQLIATRQSPPGADEAWNSDLAFLGNYILQGNFNGFVVWDAVNPRNPTLVKSYLCPASQSDVSVFKNLLFVSSEARSGRLDCGTQAPQEPVSPVRMRGIRIFDITDIRNPKYIHNVQTCRGSHTHSLVTDPNDAANVYIYVSGSADVRPTEELSICSGLSPDQDPNSSLFRIEVIQVPLAAPQDAKIVTAARVFA
ncbi:MAG: LVIVD repeat-containing protein, partial [Longimicrobiales bacterium]